MWGIGMGELILILIIILILFGGKKLPELARSLGEAVKEFKRASTGLESDTQLGEAAVDQEIDELSQLLGIDKKGKTKTQLIKEIREKIEERIGGELAG